MGRGGGAVRMRGGHLEARRRPRAAAAGVCAARQRHARSTCVLLLESKRQDPATSGNPARPPAAFRRCSSRCATVVRGMRSAGDADLARKPAPVAGRGGGQERKRLARCSGGTREAGRERRRRRPVAGGSWRESCGAARIWVCARYTWCQGQGRVAGQPERCWGRPGFGEGFRVPARAPGCQIDRGSLSRHSPAGSEPKGVGWRLSGELTFTEASGTPAPGCAASGEVCSSARAFVARRTDQGRHMELVGP